MLAAEALLVFLAPERFIARATRLAVLREFQTNRQLKAAFPNEALPPEKLKEFENTVRDQVSKIRGAFLHGIGITLLALAAGALVGLALRQLLGIPTKTWVYALQALGAAVILGATLAEVGRKIETWSGETLAEQINAAVFRFLYVIGTFLFVISVVWDAP